MAAFYWLDWNVFAPLPDTAVKSGNDVDGQAIYVGKAYHNTDWIPAKVVPGKRIAYISYGGMEYIKRNCQILCERKLEWQWCSEGKVPTGAIEGSLTEKGEILYIGRVSHNGSAPIGKIHPSHKVCYIPFAGKEVAYSKYEVLTVKQ